MVTDVSFGLKMLKLDIQHIFYGFRIATWAGPISESKGLHHPIFQKKGKMEQKNVKKGKIFENLGISVQNLKILWKREGDCAQ